MKVFLFFFIVSLVAAPTSAQLAIQQVGGNLNRPVFVTHAGDGSGRLFVIERNGTIRIVNADGNLIKTPFLDISDLLEVINGEQGLLGLAFHDDYEVTGTVGEGKFYVNYTGVGGGTRIAEYQVSTDDPDVSDPGSARMIMFYEQPFQTHNGGWIGFGPDGFLYIAAGDGGGVGDPFNNASRLNEMLGKIHRINVDKGDDFPTDPNQNYEIPADNPFVGVQDAIESIWHFGFRNPWRVSFDRDNGDLWIADVGLHNWEEVNHNAGNEGGLFYGWRCREGFHKFAECGAEGWTDPQLEYPHNSGGCSVTGGYVYRGCQLGNAYQGLYFFGDFCAGEIWTLDAADGYTRTTELSPDLRISSFGEDEDGELYVIDFDFGSNGKLFKIINPTALDKNNNGTPDACEALPCLADLTGDGSLNFFDVSAFLSAFSASDPSADFTDDGSFNFFDVSAFLIAFAAGCP